MNDWSGYFIKAEASMKKASDLLLLHDYENGVAEMVKAKAFMEMVFLAICRNK
jgi:hypothetical protein